MEKGQKARASAMVAVEEKAPVPGRVPGQRPAAKKVNAEEVIKCGSNGAL